MIALGAIVAVSSFSVVRAERVKPAGSVSYSCSSGTACVEGNSSGSSTWGVYGVATSADGLHGVTSSTNGNSGASGISTGSSGSAHGVYGRSSNGQGIYGTSSSDNGIEGHSTATDKAGVAGYQLGTTTGGFGVQAESADTTGNYGAIYAQGNKTQTNLFAAFNMPNDVSCLIDSKANLSCSGTIAGGAVRMRHRNGNGQQVLAYASESATATIEDVGTARMVDGIASVQIDRSFASVMNHRWYYVFLTPLGDTRGLYVSVKTPASFTVRETEHGRSSLEFDYRIVANPLDAKNDRLPLAPALNRPIMHPAR